jgi:hypothetical protein
MNFDNLSFLLALPKRERKMMETMKGRKQTGRGKTSNVLYSKEIKKLRAKGTILKMIHGVAPGRK